MTGPTTGPSTGPDLSGVRLVATDLDGTLLRSDGTVSERTRRTLAAVEAAGIPVVFVTARPLRWMDDLWALVGAHGLAVISNGALVYDVAARRVRSSRGIAPAAGLALVDAVRRAVPGAQVAIETVAGIRLEPAYDEPHHVPPGSPVGDLADVWDLPALKVLVRDGGAGHERDGGDGSDFHARVAAAVGAAGVATWSVPGLVEVSAPGVTKASAWRPCAPTSAWPASRCSPSATCPTTWRCSPGPARPSRWRGRTRRTTGRRPPDQRQRRRRGGPGAVRTGPRRPGSVLMCRVTPRSRLLLARLAPVALLCALVAGGPVAVASAGAAGRVKQAPDTGPVVADPSAISDAFVGRVKDVQPYGGDVPKRVEPGRAYIVNVVAVFGEGTIDLATGSEQTTVEVRTAPNIPACGSFPSQAETQRYLFQAKRASSGKLLFVRSCEAIVDYDKSFDDALVDAYGEKRFMDAQDPTPPAPDPPAINFLCPATGEVLPDPSDPAVDCDSVSAPTSTDRRRRPGLALVILGVLGLVVLRRGRRRIR